MKSKLDALVFVGAVTAAGLLVFASHTQGRRSPEQAALLPSSSQDGKLDDSFHPNIPPAWDDKAVQGLELPLAQRDRSPRYMNAEEYYKLKVRPIYRSYPIYVKGREPAGYREWLKQQEPEIIFDPSKLHTKADWIAAGKLVFESGTKFSPATPEAPAEGELPVPARKDGTLVAIRYYVRKKGVLDIGFNACADCHTRVMPDGSLWEGAQGVVGRIPQTQLRKLKALSADQLRRQVSTALWIDYGAPWVMSREQFEAHYTQEEFVREVEAGQPGVLPRQGTGFSHPVHIPSLIGVQYRKYLDATGLVRQRSIGDLMRHAILNEGLDTLGMEEPKLCAKMNSPSALPLFC